MPSKIAHSSCSDARTTRSNSGYYCPRVDQYSESDDGRGSPPSMHHEASGHLESPAYAHLSSGVRYHSSNPDLDHPYTHNPALLVPVPGLGPVFRGVVERQKTVAELFGLAPGIPISLDSLADPLPGRKPDYTYPTLVKLAIYSSEERRLTLRGIYDAIERRFPWFRTCEKPNAWRTSIRHCLSLLAVFQKVPRPTNEPGKGNYWTVDFSKGDGNKRERKRSKRPKRRTVNSESKTLNDTSPMRDERSDLVDSEDEISDFDVELNIEPPLQQLTPERLGSQTSTSRTSTNSSPWKSARSSPY